MERRSANSQPIFSRESPVRISAKTTRMYPKGSMSRWVEHLPDSDSQLHWVICARGSSKANKSNSRPWVFAISNTQTAGCDSHNFSRRTRPHANGWTLTERRSVYHSSGDSGDRQIVCERAGHKNLADESRASRVSPLGRPNCVTRRYSFTSGFYLRRKEWIA